jgi:mannose-6-phosphate isomerase
MILPVRIVEKPWGRNDLPSAFASGDRRVGEIWFLPPEGADDLLVKLIFTSERLSVQVHPNDLQARASGHTRGKEECWLVTHAEPGACLGIGLKTVMTADAVREAALSGAIEELIDWRPVEPGDFFYIPAGTIHAIGAGVSLIEVQQNADLTYRLFDYGRPRELHLEDGMAVATLGPYDPSLHRKVRGGHLEQLVSGPYFHLTHSSLGPVALDGSGPTTLIPLSGHLTCAGQTLSYGEAVLTDTPEAWTASIGTDLLIARSTAPSLPSLSVGAAQ